MGYHMEAACNGCAECVHCHLVGERYKVFHCDICGNDHDVSELRRYKGEDVCFECFLGLMEDEWDELPEVQD